MGSNWAQEFRRRIEEDEGKYTPAENLNDVDDEEVELDDAEDDGDVEDELEPDELEEEEAGVKVAESLAMAQRAIQQQWEKLRQDIKNMREEAERQRVNEQRASTGAAMAGFTGLLLMPLLYQAISQAFQPIMQRLGSQSPSSPAASQQWVTCRYCGYQCLGYNGMPCPQCGRS